MCGSSLNKIFIHQNANHNVNNVKLGETISYSAFCGNTIIHCRNAEAGLTVLKQLALSAGTNRKRKENESRKSCIMRLYVTLTSWFTNGITSIKDIFKMCFKF